LNVGRTDRSDISRIPQTYQVYLAFVPHAFEYASRLPVRGISELG
jgi:hypothetical protein